MSFFPSTLAFPLLLCSFSSHLGSHVAETTREASDVTRRHNLKANSLIFWLL